MITKEKIEVAEKQIYEHQQGIAYDISHFPIDLLIEKRRDSLYIPDNQLLSKWDIYKQAKFIESVILGLPIPFVFVTNSGNNKWELIDGAQRIESLIAFLSNQLELIDLEILTDLNGFRFEDLSIMRQRKFRNRFIPIVILSQPTSEKNRIEAFALIHNLF